MSTDSLLQDILEASLARVRGTEAVAQWLDRHPEVEYDHVIAFGKAASAMTLGALRARPAPRRGLVITKHGHLDDELGDSPQIECVESDHPVPGEASLRAGQRLVEFLGEAPADARFLALISGGASSLVEVLAPNLDLQGLSELTERLLAEGLAITEMNAVRRSISCIKGGRLAHYLDGRPACALMISDVPGDDPAVIGSGPLTAVRDEVLPSTLSDGTRQLIEKAERMPVPPPEAFQHLQTHIIATLEDAKEAAACRAEELGFPVHRHPEFLEDEAGKTGMALGEYLKQIDTPPGVHIWGGETTVRLPENPGRGGRNQHLALAAATALEGVKGIRLLACGTDGTDGPTEDAGGEVDGGTVLWGQEQGLDAEQALAQADAGSYLADVGALVTTGPTGTNVMDVVLALKGAMV